MRKFDLSLRSSRSSYFATFRHQLTILSKTDALDEEKWRSEERFSRNAETDLVCRLLLEKKNITRVVETPEGLFSSAARDVSENVRFKNSFDCMRHWPH